MNKILFLTGLFAVSCTIAPKKDYRFIEIPDTVNEYSNKALNESQVRYDVSQLIYALKKAYSGRRFLPKKEFPDLIEKISRLEQPQTAFELCETIDKYLDQVSDNHLNAKFNNKICYKSHFNRDGSVGNNYYTKGEVHWDAQIRRKEGHSALLLSITSFPSHKSPLWNGFIQKVKSLLPKSDLVVLDMRGNGGGDDTVGKELSDLLAGTKLKTPYRSQWTSQTPESFQLLINTFEYWIRKEKAEGKVTLQYLLELKEEFKDKRNQAVQGKIPLEKWKDIGKGDGLTDFKISKSIQKLVYILFDADCGSSCESTIDFFEFNTLVKTVGQNSAGYIHFGNNGNVILKNSGIRVQMAISYNSYQDGRFIEKIGITPDIRVPSGKNAMAFAWKDYLTQWKRVNKR